MQWFIRSCVSWWRNYVQMKNCFLWSKPWTFCIEISMRHLIQTMAFTRMYRKTKSVETLRQSLMKTWSNRQGTNALHCFTTAALMNHSTTISIQKVLHKQLTQQRPAFPQDHPNEFPLARLRKNCVRCCISTSALIRGKIDCPLILRDFNRKQFLWSIGFRGRFVRAREI